MVTALAMAIRLICGDGEVRIPQIFFPKMSLFQDEIIAKSHSYVLRCKASCGIVNLLLGRIYDDNERVEITEDNVEELRGLCKELGFSGLDEEFRVFVACESEPTLKKRLVFLEEHVAECDVQIQAIQNEFKTLRERVEKLDVIEMKLEALEALLNQCLKGESAVQERVAKHEMLFVDVHRQLSESRKHGSMLKKSGQLVKQLAEKIDQLSQAQTQSSEALQKVAKAIDRCAKRVDVEAIAEDVMKLKQSDRKQSNEVRVSRDKSGMKVVSFPNPSYQSHLIARMRAFNAMFDDSDIEGAPGGHTCTYSNTGRNYIEQKWYHCRTCGLVGDLGCCEACARTCHEQRGHDVFFDGIGKCFCDCGAGEGRCRCLCLANE